MSITYKFQHAHIKQLHPEDGWFEGEITIQGAEALPRKGDALEFDGSVFEVASVVHVVESGPESVVPQIPTVTVK